MENWSKNRPLYDKNEEGDPEQVGETHTVTVISDNIDYIDFAKTRRYGETPDYRVSAPFRQGPESFIEQNNISNIQGATIRENGKLQQIENPEMVEGRLETSNTSYEFEKVVDIMFQNQSIDSSRFSNGEAHPEITMHLSELDNQKIRSVREELGQYDIEADQELKLAREEIEKHTFDWYSEAMNKINQI